jgi:hypothetical protein
MADNLRGDLEMTRFGVRKHLRVLVDAGLVVAKKNVERPK